MNQKGEYLKKMYNKLEREIKREQIIKILANNLEKIEYSPVYQRNYIWNDAKANKLIETIIINGEVPPLVGVIDKGKYEIIDGRQRFESILRFANDEFILKANYLNVIKDLGGCKYSTLPPNIKEIFDEYRLKMITYTIKNGCYIDAKDLDKVKRDLFRRYNYGMTALSKSEIARAKYLYDDLTNLIRNHFLINEEDNEIFTNMFLAITKREDNKKNKRNKLNLMLMITRELLTMPYIPIIGVKTVKTGNVVIERYYEKFVKKEDINDKKDEFIKILHVLSKIKDKLKEKNNNLAENILLFKTIYWMLALLYKFYPNEFYDFKINQFVHYLEEKNNAFEYFELYNNMRTINIINRYNYVKNYITEVLQLNIDEHLKEIINNRNEVIYRSKTKISSKENWNGLGNRKQILTIIDTFTVNDMIKYSNENRLIVRPVYQRGETKSIEKASKIIESICLGVKLPPIYLLVNRNENSLDSYTVIDGQQRLISILRFMGEIVLDENFDIIDTYKKNFALRGCTSLDYLNGKTYDGDNKLSKEIRNDIKDYELDIIRIDEQANPDFDAVDMFLRLNENPCTISKNSFEMWNSYDITNLINKIKLIAKNPLFKQDGNKMKEEELVTILAYMVWKNIDFNNCYDFFKIHLYTENKDTVNERIEVKISINNKYEITHFLESMEPQSLNEQKFSKCIDEVNLFVKKIEFLTENNIEEIVKCCNPYLSIIRRCSMKDFYIMFLLLRHFDNHIIKTYHKELLNDMKNIFELMKKMPKNKDVDYFMDYIQSIIQKYDEKIKM